MAILLDKHLIVEAPAPEPSQPLLGAESQPAPARSGRWEHNLFFCKGFGPLKNIVSLGVTATYQNHCA